MKKLILLGFMWFFATTSCSKKHNVVEKDVPSADSAVSLSFFSRGAGIDHTSFQMLEDTMHYYEKKYGDTIVYTSRRWGREGEIDYCFPVQNTQYFRDFSLFLKRNFEGNENVHYSKSLTCEEQSSD